VQGWNLHFLNWYNYVTTCVTALSEVPGMPKGIKFAGFISPLEGILIPLPLDSGFNKAALLTS
jgi:hypothetical protein